MKHILSAEQFDRATVDSLLKEAQKFEGVRNNSMKGKILASLFYEPSTRTRLSFESAFLRLGGNVITMEDGKSSSQSKGETLEDSIRMVSGYADGIVMRHAEVGAAQRAASVSSIPIINAGDGNMGEHPTQALLDLYTIQKEIGHVENLHVAFVGNIKYYRSPRSLTRLLALYNNVKISFVSSPEMGVDEETKQYLESRGVLIEETEDLEDCIGSVDVLYQTRIAKEWIPSNEEYEKQKGRYALSSALVDSMKEGSVVMHPLPRIDEIAEDIDDSPKAAYFRQAANAVPMRMALLKHTLS